VDLLIAIWKFLGENTSELIASSALGLTIWQGYLARRHNKLSVSPHLAFSTSFSDRDPHFSIDIKNNGLGTAIITSFEIMIDGVTQKVNREEEVILIYRQLNIPHKERVGGRYFNPGDSISAGEVLNIIAFTLKADVFLERNIKYAELDRIQLIIKYKSLYDVSYEVKLDPKY
jgi:hypothetical protein